MKTYAKLTDGQLITTCIPDDDPELIAQITADGFKPYDESAEKPEVGEFQEAVPVYREDADRITLYWEITDNSPEKIAAGIARLQSELAATDYQIIKSYEYSLAGEQPPYDVAAIHAARQELRDRIKVLERLPTE